MECTVASSIDTRAWDALAASDAGSSFFQSHTWSDLIAETIPGHEQLFAVGMSDGRVVAGLPAIRRSRGPVHLVESMPFGTYGGVLLSDDAPAGAAAALVRALLDTAGGATLGQMRIVDFPGRLDGACDGFVAVESDAQIVRLNRPYEDVWDGFRPSARNKIRKAQNAGVTVREASGTADFLAYHALLEECSVRWGADNPFGADFFAALAHCRRDAVQVWLAEHNGIIIAGDLNFVSATSVFNWGNVSHRESVSLAPVPLLHAHALEDACARGFETYNLGGSAGIEAVAKFKSAFGTEPVTYREYVLEKGWMRLGKRLRGHGGGDAS